MKKVVLLLVFLSFGYFGVSRVDAQRPQSNEFNCEWNGSISRCKIQFADCDRAGGYNPDPNFCDQFSTPADCQGKTSFCILAPMPTLDPSPPPPPGSTIPVYDPGCSSGTSYYGYSGVKTALGCLPTDPQYFINLATPWAVGIGAGIAFLLGVFGAIMIVLSAGNPEKMQAGKEMITSAVGGIILIVFSVFILRVIGVDVLKLF